MFFVSLGDAPEVFDAIEEAFDAVAFFVKDFAVASLPLSVCL